MHLESLMSDQIHQMTIEYKLDDDRLLFKVATRDHTEYRMWLTRRLIRGLWGPVIRTFEAQTGVEGLAAAPVKQAVMSLKHQEVVQSGDYSQKHDPEAKPESGDLTPMLAVAAACEPLADGLVTLKLKTSQGHDVNFNINEEMLHAFCHLVRSGVERAQWDIDVGVGDAAFAVSGSTDHLH